MSISNCNAATLPKLLLICFLALTFHLGAIAAAVDESIAVPPTKGITLNVYRPSGGTRQINVYSGYTALVIGCDSYWNGWLPLGAPVKDARDIATLLGDLGWEVNKLENPNGDQLRRAFNELIVGPGRDEQRAVLVWFSGHGHTLPEAGGGKLGYIVPVDAPDPKRDEIGFMEKAVNMRFVETAAKRIQARHVLMVFDSCFSGSIFSAVRGEPTPYIQEMITRKVRQFITAGTENEVVMDQSIFKSVFVQAVGEGLADLNGDGYVTGLELGSYLQEKVVNYSRQAQHPQFGKINDPQLDKGDFVFALKDGAKSFHPPPDISDKIIQPEPASQIEGPPTLSLLVLRAVEQLRLSQKLDDSRQVWLVGEKADPELFAALNSAFAKTGYQVSDQAPTRIWARRDERNDDFWERPYRQTILEVRVEREGMVLWTGKVVSEKELIPSTLAIPVRVVLAMLLLPLLTVFVPFRIDCDPAKKWRWRILWGITVILIALSYIWPTYLR